MQQQMTGLVGQLILQELEKEITTQMEYGRKISNGPLNLSQGRDQLICEVTAGAYKHAMNIVAEQMNIKIAWGKKGKRQKWQQKGSTVTTISKPQYRTGS